MKSLKEFANIMVTIDQLDNGGFGFYPFQMVSRDKAGDLTMASLCLNDVGDCYASAKRAMQEGAVDLLLAVDFPRGLDIPTDFVGIFSVTGTGPDAVTDVEAWPYDPATGNRSETVTEGTMLALLQAQFNTFIFS